jgi:hypothetical protein
MHTPQIIPDYIYRKHIRMNKLYACFMQFVVCYAQFMHDMYAYFNIYIRGFIQKVLRTNIKNHWNIWHIAMTNKIGI